MSLISQAYARCADENRAAVIPYFMAGFPSEGTFAALIKSAANAGADIIEVGIPFSDPVADGPLIQQAGQVALANGANIEKTLAILRHSGVAQICPVVIMSYLNPIIQYGIKKFAHEARASGVSGLIIPDLIIEEGSETEAICADHQIDLVYIFAPSSSHERILEIASRSRGFVYAASVMGVTGARRNLPEEIFSQVRDAKSLTDIPIAIGFGISTVEAAAKAACVADGIVVGSALIERIDCCRSEESMFLEVAEMIRQLRTATMKKRTDIEAERRAV